MKRLMQKAKTIVDPPQVSGKVDLQDDPNYEYVDTGMLYGVEYRDAPVVIHGETVYYGTNSPGNGKVIDVESHSGILEYLAKESGFDDEDNLSDAYESMGLNEAIFGYYIDKFLGYPSVLLINFGDTSTAARVIKQTDSNVLVYVIEDFDKNDLLRIAKNY